MASSSASGKPKAKFGKNRRVSARTVGSASLTLLGAGRMGMAMARGWVGDMAAAGVKSIALVDPFVSEDAEDLGKHECVTLNPSRILKADIVVIALKPQVFMGEGNEVSEAVLKAREWVGRRTLVLSVMAGVTIKQLDAAFPDARCVRAMPNTPGSVGMGVTAYCLSDTSRKSDARIVERLLAPLGAVEGPLNEDLMNAVTAISGSGPAYVFLLAEAMAAAGWKLGLDKDMAERLAVQTVVGSAALMEQSGSDPETLRREVTSPNGTTQAALDVLMSSGGLPNLMRNATESAARRAKDLSEGD